MLFCPDFRICKILRQADVTPVFIVLCFPLGALGLREARTAQRSRAAGRAGGPAPRECAPRREPDGRQYALPPGKTLADSSSKPEWLLAGRHRSLRRAGPRSRAKLESQPHLICPAAFTRLSHVDPKLNRVGRGCN